MNGATLRLAYDNGKKLDNISAFTKEAHQISDEALVVKTTHSGKYYHLRMWVKNEKKYFRKSLKTVFLETALERARIEVAKVITNVESGRRVFASPIHLTVEIFRASPISFKRLSFC